MLIFLGIMFGSLAAVLVGLTMWAKSRERKPEYVSSNGVKYFYSVIERWRTSDIEAEEAILRDYCSANGMGKLFESAVKIAVVNVMKEVTYNGKPMAGLQLDNVLSVRWQPKIENSAALHELTHLVICASNTNATGYNPDYNHTQPIWKAISR